MYRKSGALVAALLFIVVCGRLHAQDWKVQIADRETWLAEIYKQHSGGAMDTSFGALLKQWPERDSADYKKYDDARTYIAMVFAGERKVAEAEQWIGKLKGSYYKSGEYFRLASNFNRYNDKRMAEKYARKAIDTALYCLKIQVKGEEGGGSPATNLAAAVTMLSNLLDGQQRYEEAVVALNRSVDFVSPVNKSGLLKLKADVLLKWGKAAEAMAIYVAQLKDHSGGAGVEDKIRKAYIAIHNGNEEGFAAFLTETKAAIAQSFQDSIRASTYKEPAPAFTLVDGNGKTVSLQDYRGKIVILDFWATWCVPCKASFPAMQMAVDKYASNKDVVFLFIDTWEYVDAPQKPVADYIAGKGFTFTILFDLKNKATGECDVVKAYKVDGIPAKFVIDKEGYIRYKMKGFNMANEIAVNELSEMIETISGVRD